VGGLVVTSPETVTPTEPSKSRWGIGPEVKPVWWDFTRQVIMFLLGLALIIDAAVTPNGRSSLIITGLVLLGLIPIDSWLTRRSGN
jgi:hypothetical protein